MTPGYLAHWCSSWLRDWRGRELGLPEHHKELLHQYEKAGATKNKDQGIPG